MKDNVAFYLGALFSAPFAAYISREWFVMLTIIFIFCIGIFGGIFGLAVKGFITDRLKLKNFGH